ncbi:hypothetical protein HHK36_032518 [Tetracentron sinense]|uniref:CCHC-type domain-containing protein n=1 Tax=Tetracentron sinense TaxID=13715 RepID=A0A835CXL5_TETSI|nr:hypothetical protein HHK36_032518 [Tetracentron sinense]
MIGSLWNDMPLTVLPTIKELMASGISVWIYSGDTDGRVPVTSSRYSIDKLDTSVKTTWYPWYTQNEVGGYAVGYQNLTFVTIRGAGHFVPSYQPARGLAFFSSFLEGKLPPSSWEDDLIAKIQDHTLIEIEDCLLEEGKHRYQNSIVENFLVDKPFNLMSAKKTMLQAWRSKSNITTLDLSKDMVLFMFDEVSDLNKVLANSPWAFNGHLLALQKWKEDTSVSEFVFDSISIWTQIHDLPLDWITRRIGMQLGSDIGCMEDVDIPFGGILGGKFLRIRVRINLNRPLVQFVIAKRKNVEPRFLEVKYERLPIFCFKCGKIGHNNRQCSTLTDSGGEKEATLLPFGVWLKAENGELLNPHLEHFKMKGKKISGIHPSSSQSLETELGMILSPANIPSKNPVTVLHLDSDLLVRRMMPRGGLGFDENPNIVGVDKMKYQSTYPEDSNNMKNTRQPQELDLEIPDIVGQDQLRNQFSYPEVSNKLKNPQQIKPFNFGNSLPKWGIELSSINLKSLRVEIFSPTKV